ncbi:hypothetical protein ACGFIG_05300 [Micromonospora sp. NPDC049048]|uniref:hypothetical protein n=1 Tax=Micromonospora sp. NPDC049048 TaxID=3364263 RepID=UPI00371E74F5
MSEPTPPDGAATNVPAKPCFVIAPIGPAGSEIRRRSNQIMKYLIRPVLGRHGYVAVRGDEMDQGGLITSHILTRIANDPLVIADLTDANPNVYYELAVRHVLRKPFIQLIDSAQRLPFDVAGLRTIHVDHRDLDSVEDAKAALARAIESIHKGEPIETPMSFAIELQDLRTSANPEEQGLAQILEAVKRIQRDVQVSRTRGASVEDFMSLRMFVERLAQEGRLTDDDVATLVTRTTTGPFDDWANSLPIKSGTFDDPWANTPPPASTSSNFDEEPPF